MKHPLLAGALILAATAVPAAAQDAAQDAEVIELTQTACQFIEPENTEHDFTTTQKADCEAINAETGKQRLAQSETIRLKPGQYIFRVKNRDVPYQLGFWIREADYDWKNPLHKLTKLSVSGGGLTPGTSKDYEVTLKPGEYVYSCPLNPTPDYKLVVTE